MVARPQERPDPVTVTVARRVAVGREADFEHWSAELTSAATEYPGFLGAGMLRPSYVGDPWHVIFRFDSAEHLQAWEVSQHRSALLNSGQNLVEQTDMHRVTGLETWFALPGRTASAPPKWKMFLVSGATFYLLNVTFSYAYGWALGRLILPLHILLISIPVTATATWLVMPRLARLLQRWLYAPPAGRDHLPPAG
jgi:antibiotic biosynthesis monooxygenase (ABM) superfamily enzyme